MKILKKKIMIKFASHVIEVGKVFPKVERPKFVKVAQTFARLSAIKELAAMMHDEYVQNMLKSAYAGQENPQRMRDDKTGSGEQINILQPFENLTPGWQKENLDAAEVAFDLVLQYQDKPYQIDADMEMLADKIHQAWSARNSYSELSKIDYADLPEEEKQKDRHQIELARDYLSKTPKKEFSNDREIVYDEPAQSGPIYSSSFLDEARINDIIISSASSMFGQTPEETRKQIQDKTGYNVSLEYIKHRQDNIRNKELS
jgi:hypothetical protein